MILSNGKIVAQDTPAKLVHDINAKMPTLAIILSLIKNKINAKFCNNQFKNQNI